jgi:hypothetical protein
MEPEDYYSKYADAYWDYEDEDPWTGVPTAYRDESTDTEPGVMLVSPEEARQLEEFLDAAPVVIPFLKKFLEQYRESK